MNKILASTLLASMPFAYHSAHAGDLGLAPSTYDWSGPYLGVNAGGAMDDVTVRRETRYTGAGFLTDEHQRRLATARDSMHSDGSGFMGGLNAGYNWQMEQVVFGLEADINALALDGRMNRDITGLFDDDFGDPALKVFNRVNYSIDSFGTLRGRLGFAIDNVMLYGTGGLAYAHMQANAEVRGEDSTGSMNWKSSESDWTLGWTLGGGVEYGFGRWSLGVEYLYADLMQVDLQSDSLLDLASDWDAAYSLSVLRATGKVRF